jgi:NAD(P)-dependent dehydrogenase (short-subunit alcohol dehydrogenase family)
MARPTGLVTGGCSGIGLALTKYLLERRWNVIQADINPPKENLDNTRFVKCTFSFGVVAIVDVC